MNELLREWAQAIGASAPHDWVVYLLRNVPGLPPIVQTIHIVCVALIVASIVFIHLRILGVAVPSQRLDEMCHRLLPWMWWALPGLLLSGSVFILARPRRYFLNPVFGIKMLSITIVLILTVVMVKLLNRTFRSQQAPTLSIKIISIASIALWLLTMLAGRWIAYAEYLFPLS